MEGQCGGTVEYIPIQKISAAAPHGAQAIVAGVARPVGRKIMSKAELIDLAKPDNGLFRNHRCGLSGACRSACEQKKPDSLAAARPIFFMVALNSVAPFSERKQLSSTIRSRSVSSMV